MTYLWILAKRVERGRVRLRGFVGRGEGFKAAWDDAAWQADAWAGNPWPWLAAAMRSLGLRVSWQAWECPRARVLECEPEPGGPERHESSIARW